MTTLFPAPALVFLAGLALTGGYFGVGFAAYIVGQRGHSRVRDAGRALVKLSWIPAVGSLLSFVFPRLWGFGTLVAGTAVVVVVLGAPVLAVMVGLDDHAVGR